jgi:hypothetical protein
VPKVVSNERSYIPGQTFFDKEKVIAEIAKSEFSKYIVSAAEKNGRRYLNIKEWYCTAYEPEWRPAKQGVMVPVQLGEDVIAALVEAHVSLSRGDLS